MSLGDKTSDQLAMMQIEVLVKDNEIVDAILKCLEFKIPEMARGKLSPDETAYFAGKLIAVFLNHLDASFQADIKLGNEFLEKSGIICLCRDTIIM